MRHNIMACHWIECLLSMLCPASPLLFLQHTTENNYMTLCVYQINSVIEINGWSIYSPSRSHFYCNIGYFNHISGQMELVTNGINLSKQNYENNCRLSMESVCLSTASVPFCGNSLCKQRKSCCLSINQRPFSSTKSPLNSLTRPRCVHNFYSSLYLYLVSLLAKLCLKIIEGRIRLSRVM